VGKFGGRRRPSVDSFLPAAWKEKGGTRKKKGKKGRTAPYFIMLFVAKRGKGEIETILHHRGERERGRRKKPIKQGGRGGRLGRILITYNFGREGKEREGGKLLLGGEREGEKGGYAVLLPIPSYPFFCGSEGGGKRNWPRGGGGEAGGGGGHAWLYI